MVKKKESLIGKTPLFMSAILEIIYGRYALWLLEKYPKDFKKFNKHYKEFTKEEKRLR